MYVVKSKTNQGRQRFSELTQLNKKIYRKGDAFDKCAICLEYYADNEVVSWV